MKRFSAIFATLLLVVGSLSAQSVEVRFLYGTPHNETEKPVSNGANKVLVRNYKLTKCADGMRLVIPKEHIATEVWVSRYCLHL